MDRVRKPSNGNGDHTENAHYNGIDKSRLPSCDPALGSPTLPYSPSSEPANPPSKAPPLTGTELIGLADKPPTL